MTTRKITLSLPEELLTEAEAAVAAGRARSVSAYVAHAAGTAKTRARSIHDVLAAWEDQAGAPSTVQARAAEEWAAAFQARNDARWQTRQGSGSAA
ncbi:MAG: hypothetical protein ACRDTU_01520 [Micromonosporaceae bacterium]